MRYLSPPFALLALTGFLLAPLPSAAAWAPTSLPVYMSVTSLLEGGKGSLLAGTAQNGLQRSTDAGVTWTRIKTPAGYSYPVKAMARGANDTLYLFDGTAMRASPDDGDTWTDLAYPPLLTDVNAIALSPGGDLYAGGPRGICRSRDKGKTWKHTGLLEETVSSILAFSDAEVFLGCRRYGSLSGGAYKSDTISEWSFIGPDNGDVLSLAIKDRFLFAGLGNSPNSGVVGADGLGAMSWFAYGKGLPAGAVSALLTAPDGNLWAASAKGVYRSRDAGANWSPTGLDTLAVQCLLRHSSGRLYAGTGLAGLFVNADASALRPGSKRAIGPGPGKLAGYGADGRRLRNPPGR